MTTSEAPGDVAGRRARAPVVLQPVCTRAYLLNAGLVLYVGVWVAIAFLAYVSLADPRRYYVSALVNHARRDRNRAVGIGVLIALVVVHAAWQLFRSETAHVLSEKFGRRFAVDELRAFMSCDPEVIVSAYTPTRCRGVTWKRIQYKAWAAAPGSRPGDLDGIRWPAPYTILHVDERLDIDEDARRDAIGKFRSCCSFFVSCRGRCADSTFSRRMFVINGDRRWWMSRITFTIATLFGLSWLYTYLFLRRCTPVAIRITKRVDVVRQQQQHDPV